MDNEIVAGIGGAAGDGGASTADNLALACARQGLHVYVYTSYQSLIRGGHSWVRLRISPRKPFNMGDQVQCMIALNQDAMDRHLQELKSGGLCVYNSDKVKPGKVPPGVQLCPLPVFELVGRDALPIMQNTAALGALTRLIGLDFEALSSVFEYTFKKKPQVVKANVDAAREGYDFAGKTYKAVSNPLARTDAKLAMVGGNNIIAMGAVNAGCKFYCAYPMSPATGILHWMGAHGKDVGVCVRQVEDEIGVANMAIGAGHMGVRAMCATSGGGFALMTEALGLAGITETPVVMVNVMRGGPSTGLPTKQEQGDLTQAVGASQGDFPRIIIAPTSIADCYTTMEEAFNLAEKYQCPVVILSDLLMSEGHMTLETSFLDREFKIDRGEMIFQDDGKPKTYLRYQDTPSGISPRAIPGLPNHLYVAASDEHDEDGVLISDVYTNPLIRKKMVDKRTRKMEGVTQDYAVPLKLEGPQEADITLVTFGSTWGVATEAVERLNGEGIKTNLLTFKYMIPFQVREAREILGKARKICVVEMNKSGQFSRHLRAETGIVAHADIRKYDGEPFEPKHVVEAVKEVLKGKNLVEVQSIEPGWQSPHPPGPGVLTTTSVH